MLWYLQQVATFQLTNTNLWISLAVFPLVKRKALNLFKLPRNEMVASDIWLLRILPCVVDFLGLFFSDSN